MGFKMAAQFSTNHVWIKELIVCPTTVYLPYGEGHEYGFLFHFLFHFFYCFDP